MKMIGRSRAWVLALALVGVGLGSVPAAASAAPRRAQCATINANVADELGWVSYFTALGNAYYQAHDIDAATSAFADADTYQHLADAGMRLGRQLGC
ncbi:MAG TPA: hypothetical protein VFH80_26925 [Solirubrobacteraceae bacterium]|nr:hypothetical protein [Solirubrobacteraceae bacterium]